MSQLLLLNSGQDAGNDSLYNQILSGFEPCANLVVGEAHSEMEVASQITKLLYPVLMVLGVLGDLAAFLLLLRLSRNAWSTSLYLATLALMELAFILLVNVPDWIYQATSHGHLIQRLQNSSDAMCKIGLFVVNVLRWMCPWLMVALAVELFITVRFPLKTYHSCTWERARAIIILIAIVVVCINLQYFFTYGTTTVMEGADEMICTYTKEHVGSGQNFEAMVFLTYIWPITEFVMAIVLPFLLATSFFVMTLTWQVREGRKQQATYEPILRKYFLDLQALNELKAASTVLLLFFILFMAFSLVRSIINMLDARELIEIPCEQAPKWQARLMLLFTIDNSLDFLFKSIIFYIFFPLCASFRKQFLGAVGKVRTCNGCSRATYNPQAVTYKHAKVSGKNEVAENVSVIQESRDTASDQSTFSLGQSKTTHV